ncbi:MAG: hypothetical protein H7Z39_05530, partial [Burkholderiaceae bacterium]|nr:hypothetical protein [Burkholderiaceae bacterium]
QKLLQDPIVAPSALARLSGRLRGLGGRLKELGRRPAAAPADTRPS